MYVEETSTFQTGTLSLVASAFEYCTDSYALVMVNGKDLIKIQNLTEAMVDGGIKQRIVSEQTTVPLFADGPRREGSSRAASASGSVTTQGFRW
jgi:hypothetical protein